MNDEKLKTGLSRRDWVRSAGVLMAASATAAERVSVPRAEAAIPKTGVKVVDRKFLCADGLRNTTFLGQHGFALKVRLPDYRSLPLSCIVGLDLKVDDSPVSSEGIVFTLNGYNHKFPELAGMHKVAWWVLDMAEIFVPNQQNLSEGKHTLDATLTYLLPYATAGALRLQSSVTRQMQLESGMKGGVA